MWDRFPLTACAETVKVPARADASAPKSSEAFAPELTLNGLAGLDVTPAGRPLSVICTEPEKPLEPTMPSATGALVPPWFTETNDDEKSTEKSGCGDGAGGDEGPEAPPPHPQQAASRSTNQFFGRETDKVAKTRREAGQTARWPTRLRLCCVSQAATLTSARR